MALCVAVGGESQREKMKGRERLCGFGIKTDRLLMDTKIYDSGKMSFQINCVDILFDKITFLAMCSFFH